MKNPFLDATPKVILIMDDSFSVSVQDQFKFALFMNNCMTEKRVPWSDESQTILPFALSDMCKPQSSDLTPLDLEEVKKITLQGKFGFGGDITLAFKNIQKNFKDNEISTILFYTDLCDKPPSDCLFGKEVDIIFLIPDLSRIEYTSKTQIEAFKKIGKVMVFEELEAIKIKEKLEKDLPLPESSEKKTTFRL